MNLFRRVAGWLRGQTQTQSTTSTSLILNDKLELARRAQYAEHYDDALKYLDEAMNIAQEHKNQTYIIDITLSRADILIAKADYETAIFILTELRQESEDRHHRAPLAYALASLGIIEQRQGNLESARHFYEQARDTAGLISTDGATGRAIAHLADTYLVEGNASYAIYLLEDALPRLIRSGDKELLGYFQGRLGDALVMSGQPNEGIAALQQGLDSAMALKHQAQVRELSQKIGIYALQVADYNKATKYLNDALRLYDREDSSPEYILLLCQLSRAYYKVDNPREGLPYAKQAHEHIENINSDSLQAMIQAAMGLCLSATDKNDEALPYLQSAEAAYANLDVDGFYLDILRNLALSQSKAGNLDTARETYAKAIEIGRTIPLQVGQIYTELAQLSTSEGDYKTALQHYMDAIKHYADSNHRNFVARSYCSIGTLYMQSGDGKMARREYEQALTQLNSTDDATTRGHILATVANAYTEFGDIESADAFYKEAIEIAKRDNDKSAEAQRRGDYGRFLTLTNNPKRAITEIMQAQNRFDELGLANESATQTGNLGLAYAHLDDHSQALVHYENSLNQLADNLLSAQIKVYRADTYYALSQPDYARSDYDSALVIAKAHHNHIVTAQALLGLGQIALDANQLEAAKNHLAEAEVIIKHGTLRRLQEAQLRLESQLVALEGDNNKAQSLWEEASKLRSILRMPEKTPDWLQKQ